jgi:membrane fusion protein (multidrug efflux system)
MIAPVGIAALAGCGKEAAPPPPLPAVQVASVLVRDVPIYIEAVGQTRGSEEVEVRARVEGYIESVDFSEGMPVEKGKLLFTIDAAPYRATVARVKGDLATAEADLARARQDVARYRPLAEKNAIPRQDLETAISMEAAASARVEAARAIVESAEIELGYTRVTAPVAGVVGKAEVRVGNLVGRGESTLLTTVSDIDPIHVRVNFAERDYLTLARKRLETEKEGKPVAPSGSQDIRMVLADESVHPYPGSIFFVDRAVDVTTGTLLVEMRFPNPEKIVRPGQFARVRSAVDFRPGAILVPQRAVRELQANFQAAVLAPGDTVQVRPITPGSRIGSLWVIDKGLNPGDVVVVEGLQKVQSGMKVQPTTVEIDESGLVASSPSTAPH